MDDELGGVNIIECRVLAALNGDGILALVCQAMIECKHVIEDSVEERDRAAIPRCCVVDAEVNEAPFSLPSHLCKRRCRSWWRQWMLVGGRRVG